VNFAFRLATDRRPSPNERAILVDTFKAQLADFRNQKENAAKLLSVGASTHDPRLDKSELAAWTTVAGMILNLDETITKE
jgi:hypothetical protein